MIAAGTGITPFFQILQACHINKDSTEMGLIFANRSFKDILLKQELDEIYAAQNFNFKLFYTIDREEPEWTGGIGHITKDMITALLPAPDDETLILTCGPPIMCSKFLLPMLLEIGHKQENIFDF